jgi:RNA methyltransferase, TrmH family
MNEISSLQNQLVKTIVDLKAKASKRRSEKKCIIEGWKELEVAIESGVVIDKILIDRQFVEEFSSQPLLENKEIYLCTKDVMEKITIRDNREKILAIASITYNSLKDVELSEKPIILILENIEKPGNLGALLRTADAAGVDLILYTNGQTDIFNHNVIRNSLGCVFSKQIVACSNEEALAFCKKHAIKTFATYLHTDQYYYSHDFQTPTALVFGTESTGISPFWIAQADTVIKIPMLGKIDSMNVSNSASILLYEVVRQRL